MEALEPTEALKHFIDLAKFAITFLTGIAGVVIATDNWLDWSPNNHAKARIYLFFSYWFWFGLATALRHFRRLTGTARLSLVDQIGLASLPYAFLTAGLLVAWWTVFDDYAKRINFHAKIAVEPVLWFIALLGFIIWHGVLQRRSS